MRILDVERILKEAIPKRYEWCNEIYGAVYPIEFNKEVSKILYCVTATKEVCDFYRKNNYDLLISHHPIPAETGVNQLVFHTALDCCPGGLNDQWADALGVAGVTSPINRDLGVVGHIAPTTLPELVNKIEDFAGGFVKGQIWLKNPAKKIKTITICTGLGGLITEMAAQTNTDCYITGELTGRAESTGCNGVIEVGHTLTERCGVNLIRKVIPGITVDLAPLELDVFHDEVYIEDYKPKKTF